MGLPLEVALVVRADQPDHSLHDGAVDIAAQARVHLDHLAPAPLGVGTPAVEGEFRGARALAQDLENATQFMTD